MRPFSLLGALVLFFALCGPVKAAESPAFLRAPVEIQKQDGERFKIQTEWAITPDQHAYGLMNRKKMAPDAGMLFVFARPQVASFWMKNTYIPLDILFVSPHRRIVQIVSGARPLDETPIVSRQEVSFVLELPGGRANEQGVSVGDYLVLPYKNN